MTVVIESDQLVPLCPHCDAPLHEVIGRTLRISGGAQFRFGKRYVYACSQCNRALSISHRKGFWAG